MTDKILNQEQALRALRTVDSATKMISVTISTESAYITVTQMYGDTVEVHEWANDKTHRQETHASPAAFATAYGLQTGALSFSRLASTNG